MRFLPVLLGWMGVKGCQCQPQIPPEPPPDPPDPTGVTGTTGDTGPAPPCAWPEIEPNNSTLEPTLLGMEQRGCGGFSQDNDPDIWTFTLENDAWLEVEVGQGNGSIAQLSFLLTPKFDSWSVSREDAESPDASVRFQAPAGDYLLQVNERNSDGGERYYYDVLVSEAKAPFPWEGIRPEVEPNDNLGLAEFMLPGEQIYGTMDGNAGLQDFDWFALTIPPGRHILDIDIDAFDHGSAGDFTVYLWNNNLENLPVGCKQEPCSGNNCCAMEGGALGAELDPFGDYDSPGAEVVYISVSEKGGIDSPANWYVLKIGLTEGEP